MDSMIITRRFFELIILYLNQNRIISLLFIYACKSTCRKSIEKMRANDRHVQSSIRNLSQK